MTEHNLAVSIPLGISKPQVVTYANDALLVELDKAGLRKKWETSKVRVSFARLDGRTVHFRAVEG